MRLDGSCSYRADHNIVDCTSCGAGQGVADTGACGYDSADGTGDFACEDCVLGSTYSGTTGYDTCQPCGSCGADELWDKPFPSPNDGTMQRRLAQLMPRVTCSAGGVLE